MSAGELCVDPRLPMGAGLTSAALALAILALPREVAFGAAVVGAVVSLAWTVRVLRATPPPLPPRSTPPARSAAVGDALRTLEVDGAAGR